MGIPDRPPPKVGLGVASRYLSWVVAIALFQFQAEASTGCLAMNEAPCRRILRLLLRILGCEHHRRLGLHTHRGLDMRQDSGRTDAATAFPCPLVPSNCRKEVCGFLPKGVQHHPHEIFRDFPEPPSSMDQKGTVGSVHDRTAQSSPHHHLECWWNHQSEYFGCRQMQTLRAGKKVSAGFTLGNVLSHVLVLKFLSWPPCRNSNPVPY